MKKLTILLLFFGLANFTFAQTENDQREQLRLEMQRMQQNMQQLLQGMGGTFGMEMDTMLLRNLDQLGEQFGDNGMLFKMDTTFMLPLEEMGENLPEMNRDNWGEGMGDMMQQLQNMMQNMDWSQMEDMMQGFGPQMPLIPAPEQFDENGDPLPKEKRIRKKKRKTYSL